jgi:YYY domain-containing protein
MLELLQMWALVELLGLICLPLTITVFHNLPDRGWAFSKAIAIALLAFCIWLPLMSIHALPFNQLFIAGTLLILSAFGIMSFVKAYRSILKVLRAHFIYIVACELIFLGMVFLLGWIRSYGPDIRSFEMFMDEGFIAAIMRSPHLPPNDMWFSGYPINYYYYAHFTVAVLAKLLGQPPSIAFNTGICMFFGLTAINLFGVTCNLVAWAGHLRTRATQAETGSFTQPSTTPAPTEAAAERPDTVYPSLLGAIPYGLLTMMMGQVLGNLAATQQWFQIHGDWSQFDWFAPSRVVDKTINEFPAFSFLLSCFHAHVLALAFTILALALALNLFLAHDAKGMLILGRGWRMPLTLGMTALVLGGLFAMNGWDFPTYLGITLVCIALQQWLAHASRFSFELVLDVFMVAVSVAALSFLLYVPFYLSFISPSQGLGLVGPADRSQLGNEVLIYGIFAFVFLSLLLATALKRWMPGLAGASPDNVVARGGMEWLGALAGTLSGGQVSRSPRRLRPGIFWLLLALVAELGAVALLRNGATFVVASSITLLGVASVLSQLHDRPRAFILLLGTVAFALVAFCEVVFLKDVFADSYPRMNTVFKFYFQAWALLSIASGAGLYFIRESFRPAAILSRLQRWLQGLVGVLWMAVLLALLLAGAVYPLAGSYARTSHYAQRTNSLDGLAYLQSFDPGDYAAIRWLNSNVSDDPVIVEAVGPDYSDYAHISAFTGLSTPMGWVGHEYQWRVNWLNRGFNAAEFSRRAGDIDSIYTDPHPDVVMALLAHYNAQYLYVGPFEQAKYPTANLHRYASFMQVVYSADGVTIYKV